MGQHIMRFEMFGGLNIWLDGRQTVDREDRVNKNLELLVLLALKNAGSLKKEELMQALWEEGEVHNPIGALKNAAYSLRKLLQEFQPDFEFIVNNEKTYRINPEIEVQTDVLQMQQLHQMAMVSELSEDERIKRCVEATRIYNGDFLPSLADRRWIMEFGMRLRRSYLESALYAAELLLRENNRADACVALEICGRGALYEPLDAGLQQMLFRAMKQLDMKTAILNQYPIVTNAFFDRLGTLPPREVRQIYQWALDTSSHSLEDMLRIKKDLTAMQRINNRENGVCWCEYELFKRAYDMIERLALRNHQVVKLMLFTLHSQRGHIVTRSDITLGMAELKEVLQQTLRRGDVCCRYSRNQYVAMLAMTNEEDSAVVEKNIRCAFNAQPALSVLRLDVNTAQLNIEN